METGLKYKLLIALIICASAWISVTYATDNSTDPTRPPGVFSHKDSQKEAGFEVEAIFYNKANNNSSSVIINGRRYVIGDKIMNATVKKIKPDKVTLQDDNGEFTITISYPPIKSSTIKTKTKKKNSEESN